MRGARPLMWDRSAAHSAQWQDLELIFCRLLQHGNMRERREGVAHASLRPAETFMHVCLRLMEAACFLVRKCANNHKLIVAGVERFLRHAYASRFSVTQTRKSLCALCIFKQTLTGLFFVHKNVNMHAILTRG